MNDVEQRIAALYDFAYWISPNLNPNLGKSEPPANVRVVGLLAYADGSTWNPGLGAGVFIWNGSAWKEFYGTWNLTPYTGPTIQVSSAPYPANPGTSRALSIVYQNLTGKPLWLSVVSYTTSQGVGMYLYSDASNPPTTALDYFDEPVALYHIGLQGVILPNNYYKVTVGGVATLTNWIETY